MRGRLFALFARLCERPRCIVGPCRLLNRTRWNRRHHIFRPRHPHAPIPARRRLPTLPDQAGMDNPSMMRQLMHHLILRITQPAPVERTRAQPSSSPLHQLRVPVHVYRCGGAVVCESRRGGKAPETSGAGVRVGVCVCGEVRGGRKRGFACDAPCVGCVVVGPKGVEGGEAGVFACEAGEGHGACVMEWVGVDGGYLRCVVN